MMKYGKKIAHALKTNQAKSDILPKRSMPLPWRWSSKRGVGHDTSRASRALIAEPHNQSARTLPKAWKTAFFRPMQNIFSDVR